MQKHPQDLVSIITKRVEAEARLAGLLRRTKACTTLDDIKTMIFEERGEKAFNAYLRDLWSLMQTADSQDIDDDALQILEDAWNYFPHHRLGGRCPADLMAEQIGAASDDSFERVEIDPDKVDDVVLALLLLGEDDEMRVWKGHDWDALDRLHQKGYISNPATRAKSVVLSDEGLREAQRLYKNSSHARSRPRKLRRSACGL